MTTLQALAVSVQRGAVPVLAAVDCRVQSGSLLGICGPNAAGKSTLLRCLAGLLRPTQGTLELDGQPLAALVPISRARAIGYLAQNVEIAWRLSVRELATLGRFPHHAPWSRLRETDRSAIEQALRQADVADLSERSINTLSGGERMRAHLARVFAGAQPVILADEPITALEPRYQFEILAALRDQAREGAAVAVVLHDLALAARYCDRLVLLDRGRVVAAGLPREVLTQARLAETFGVRGVWTADHGQLSALQPLA